jgi:hypothetical protein
LDRKPWTARPELQNLDRCGKSWSKTALPTLIPDIIWTY